MRSLPFAAAAATLFVVVNTSGASQVDGRSHLRRAASSGVEEEASTSAQRQLFASCPAGHTLTEIDFDELGLEPGTYVESQFAEKYGVRIVGRCLNQYGVAREGNWARLFDSSNPTSDDMDLGSPNKNCRGCTLTTCPGFSRQNGPGFLFANTTNCVTQHNILIVHEGARSDDPDDTSHGAYLEFMFDDPITKFWSVELMDLDTTNQDKVTLFDSYWNVLKDQTIYGLGDNTVQEVDFSYDPEYGAKIKMVQVHVASSGAVTKFKWCRPPPTTCPQGTQKVTLDFEKTADGSSVPPAAWIGTEFLPGYHVKIMGHRFLEDGTTDDSNNFARIFDSSYPTFNDADLGSPNENCPSCDDHRGGGGFDHSYFSTSQGGGYFSAYSGYGSLHGGGGGGKRSGDCPGKADPESEGYTTAAETNCDSQYNVLIINDGKTDQPDDNAHGGYLEFEFYEPIPRFLEMELMDIEVGASATIELMDSANTRLWDETFPGIGDNALQTTSVDYTNDDIKTVRLTLPDSGAVASLSYCMVPPLCPYGEFEVSLDFDDEVSTVSPGDYVENQFLDTYNVKVEGKRRNEFKMEEPGNWARIFDSSNPTGDAYDLGSPNRDCKGCTSEKECPGVSKPHTDGLLFFLTANETNCVAQNNILILHGGLVNDPPYDSEIGGYLDFWFERPISKFNSVQLMDIEGLGYNVIQVFGTSGNLLTQIRPPGLGDNTVQDVLVEYKAHKELIKQVRVNFDDSAALLDLKYCLPKEW